MEDKLGKDLDNTKTDNSPRKIRLEHLVSFSDAIFALLESKIKDRIAQTKHKMHKTQERTITDRLWPEIETLNWVKYWF